MAKCEICGKSYSVFSGGEEIYTGAKLKVCGVCGERIKKAHQLRGADIKECFRIVDEMKESCQFESTKKAFDNYKEESLKYQEKYLKEKEVTDAINAELEAKRIEEDKEKKCNICGEPFGFKNGYGISLKDGKICDKCFEKTSYYPKYRKGEDNRSFEDITYSRERMRGKTLDEIKMNIEKQKADEDLKNNYRSTVRYENSAGQTCIEFDDNTNTFVVRDFAIIKETYSELFHYEQIKSFSLLEDNGVVTTGGGGASLVGGVLAGTTGAVIGAATASKTSKTESDIIVKIDLEDASIRMLYVRFLTSPDNKTSKRYQLQLQRALQCVKTLQRAYDKVNKVEKQIEKNIKNEKKMVVSVADEIRKLKQLWDEGIITEEEFQIMKRKLIGI